MSHHSKVYKTRLDDMIPKVTKTTKQVILGTFRLLGRSTQPHCNRYVNEHQLNLLITKPLLDPDI